MRGNSTLVLLGSLIWVASQEPSPSHSEPNTVALLGVYQFADPTDREGPASAAPAGPRPEEIQGLVERLKSYGATMVAVGSSSGAGALEERFRAFKREQVPAAVLRDPVEQVAFPLARQLGHETIYPIGSEIRLSQEKLSALLSKSPFSQQLYQQMLEYGERVAGDRERLFRQKPLLEFLIDLNQEASIARNHAFYADYILRMGEQENYAGPDLVADWYRSNLRILHHLHRLTRDRSAERVLIVIDQIHLKYLRDLLRDSSHFRYLEILPILKGRSRSVQEGVRPGDRPR